MNPIQSLLKKNLIRQAPRIPAIALLVAATGMTGMLANAAVYEKADNSSALNTTTAWTNGIVPGPSDIAQWDSTVSAGNTTNALGGSLTWGGISIINPNGPVQIGVLPTTGTLTLGSGGIDMSAASQDLTVSNAVTLPDYTVQTWNVPSGRALSLQGAFTRTGGAALTFNGSGTINIVGGTASAMLGYGLYNGTDVAALDGSKNVSTVASVIGYASVSAWTQSLLQQYVDMDASSTATGTTDDINVGTKIWFPRVVRFNTPQPSGRGYWSVNAYNGQTALNALVNTVLVTTNVGACDVIYKGNAHTFRWGQTSANSELILDQENTAGSLYINGVMSQKTASLANMMTKRGAGRVVVNTPLVHSGPTRILKGELMVNSTTVPTSIFTINTNATLSGIGNVSGSTTNLSGGMIWPGTNGFGTLTVGALTLNAGSGLKFYSSSLPTTNTVALLNITNAVTVNGPVNVSIVSGHPSVGQYPLIQITSALSAPAFANFNLASLPLHTFGYLSNNATAFTVDLVVTNVAEPLSWATGSDTWNTNGASIWQDAVGNPSAYQEVDGIGDSVLFGDALSGASPITVTLNTSLVPAATTVNSTKAYTISGSGSIAGAGSLTKAGSGVLTLTTANSFAGGLKLNGGILNFSALTNLGAGSITFAGGTLQYNGNSDDISVLPITFSPGGGTIDTAGQTVNFANPIGAGGGGGLTKTGAGTLTLNGTNLLTGNMTVNQGTLALGANTYISNSAAIIVNGGAVLDASSSGVNLALGSLNGEILAGAGTVNGTVTAPSGTVISPGTNGVFATLTLANDLDVSGGTLVMDVATTNHDLLTVGGNLTLQSGSLLVITNSTSLTNGVYKLISYSGSLLSGAGSSANLTLVGFSQAGKAATLSDANANEIDLIVSPSASDSLTWAGTSSSWDLANTTDWLLGGTTPWAYTNGDFVTFNDNGSGSTTVNLQAAVTPGSVTVSNNAVAQYVFADDTGVGGGKISGHTSLVKDGPSTLIMQTANTYTGPTTIKNGTLQIGNGGIGDIGTGNVTNNGSLVFNQGDSNAHTVAGAISGTGSILQQGSSTVVLAQNNTYTGPTTISAGSLQIGTGGAVGSLGTGLVTNNGNLLLDRSGVVSVANNISGSGALTKLGSSSMTFTGPLAYQGNTSISNGMVKLTANDQIPDANSVAGSTGWLILDGGVTAAGTFDLGGFNETVNALSGLAGTVNGLITNSGTASSTTNVLTVLGTAATTFNGVISGNANGSKMSLVVLGANELRMNGANTFAGGTIVGGTATLGVGPGATLGAGGIIMSNGTTFYMHNAGNSPAFPADNITIAPGAGASMNSSTLGNGFSGQVSGSLNSTNYIIGPVSAGLANVEQWSNFLGTVLIPSGGTLRFASTSLSLNGSDSATFKLEGTGVLQTRNAGTVHLGALSGNGNITNPQANSGTGIFQIGFNNANSSFSGAISGNNSIVKVGTGLLELAGAATTNVTTPDGFTYYTNVVYVNNLTYVGSTTVNNGALKIQVPNVLTNSSAITMGASSSILDASEMGYIDINTNLVTNGVFEVVSGQALSGIGTILASKLLLDAGSTFNVGLPTGLLTTTNNVELAGDVNMSLNPSATPNSSELVAQSFTIDSTAALVVTNVGGTLTNGTVFQLFNQPVAPGSFSSITLPGAPYVWTTNLNVNGSITLASGGVNPVNTTPPTITNSVSGDVLTLSWPADHLGWVLSMQTNSLAVGLSTNWVDVPGSSSVTSTNITLTQTNGAVFFRMHYP